MGFVVYEERTGRAQKYYKKESVAKRICTQHNRERDYPWGYNYRPDERWIYCSYEGYEGVLMGMKEPERKIWAFCRG
jgi:FMN phosphatase YigB (HAD superfamily)